MTDPNARLPELLRQVTAAGFRIQNIFHRMDGQCQANLRSVSESPQCFEWAHGPTFADALEAALTKASGGKTVTPRIPVGLTALPEKSWPSLHAVADELNAHIDLEEAIAAAKDTALTDELAKMQDRADRALAALIIAGGDPMDDILG